MTCKIHLLNPVFIQAGVLKAINIALALAMSDIFIESEYLSMSAQLQSVLPEADRRACAPGAEPHAEDPAAIVKTSQATVVNLAAEDEPASTDEFVTISGPPPVEELDAFILRNTPALVDDDPTRFGLVDFLSSKGESPSKHSA